MCLKGIGSGFMFELVLMFVLVFMFEHLTFELVFDVRYYIVYYIIIHILLYIIIYYIIHILLYYTLLPSFLSLISPLFFQSFSLLFPIIPIPLSSSPLLPYPLFLLLLFPMFSSFHLHSSSSVLSSHLSSSLFFPILPFQYSSLSLFPILFPIPISFILYVSGLPSPYLYPINISFQSLTPHVLSEWMVEV